MNIYICIHRVIGQFLGGTGHPRPLVSCNLSPSEFPGDQWVMMVMFDPLTALSVRRCLGSLLKDSGKIMQKIFDFTLKGKKDDRNDY